MTSNVNGSNAALQYAPFSGRIGVYLFGRSLDWNIGGDNADVVKRRVGEIANDLGVCEIYAPRPAAFNAQIVCKGDLKEEIPITNDESPIIMYRGCDADGVQLGDVSPKGKRAFWLSSADCITIVAHHHGTGWTVAAHGGRDCLVDRGRINGGQSRKYESVVHAIADRFSKKEMKNVKVFMTCGIGPEHFEHRCDDEKYGPANTKMAFDILAKWGPTCLFGDHTLGKISLSEVIRSQFVSLGVSPHNIGYDGVETFDDRDRFGDHRWWSYRRGDGKNRNGVLVVQNW